MLFLLFLFSRKAYTKLIYTNYTYVILASLIFTYANTQSKISNHLSSDNIVISLGNCCKVKIFIKESQLNSFSYPLDWVLSSFKSIFSLFQNDFKGYLHKNNLKDLEFWDYRLNKLWPDNNPKFRIVYDKKYDIESRHDFLVTKSILSQYPEVENKYNRRIKRLYEALNSNKKVWLIRKDINKSQTIALKNLIKHKFSNLNFTIVALNNTSEFKEQWNIPNIKNFYINDPTYRLNNKTKQLEYNSYNNYTSYYKIFKSLGLKPKAPSKQA